MKIIKNEEINEDLFSQMIRLDHEVWPLDDESYLPTSYLHRLYENSKDGLFFAVDDEEKLIGYQTLIFVDKDNFQKYYETGDFTVLKNMGMKRGENILYIYERNRKSNRFLVSRTGRRGISCISCLCGGSDTSRCKDSYWWIWDGTDGRCG